jgi:VWFA-related protein
MMTNRVLTFSSVVVFLLAIAPVPHAQQPAPTQGPTFRLAVDYVEVDAVVTDRDGNFVRGLAKDDFEILEDGKPQTVTSFTVVDLPVRKPSPPAYRTAPVEPDVRSNAGQFDGRVIVLVLDDLMVDPQRTNKVRAAAGQFINRFVSENDVVAVIQTGAGGKSAQNFTTNRALMLSAVNKFLGKKIASVTSATIAEQERTNAAGRTTQVEDPLRFERASRARDTLTRLRAASEYLSAIHGRRKTMIWFSEGIDSDFENPMDHQGTLVRDELAALIGAAQRAGVAFYAIDPRGVGAGMDEIIGIRSLPEDPTSPLGPTSLMDEVRRSQGSLHTIANETGGFAVTGGGDINEQFAKIVEQNSSYYLLGYYPTVDRRDGKFRSLDVRVKRPGLRVQHRKGYVAPRGRAETRSTPAKAEAAPPELRAAVESPLPIAGLPVRVWAAPFIGSAKRASIAIILEVDPAGLRFQQQGESFNENLEILMVPVDASGKPLDGARDQAPMKLSPKTHEVIRTNGFRVARRLDLPPGRYQLHIAVQSGNSKAVGALTYDLEVPDFAKTPLAMSGIALMSAAADRIPTAPPDKDFTDVLPMAATAIRNFDRSDTLFYFAEIYPRRSGTPHAVQVQTTVTSEDGKVLFRRSDERKTAEMKTQDIGFGHSAKFPLTEFAPGRYVLRIEAKTLTAEGATAARELEFRVR